GDYSDKRRPDSVTFTDDRSDAQRRDFTVNALFLDPTETGAASARSPLGGRVIDYVGGTADLQTRTIRAVGDPAARLNEDHLRALRAVRFASRLGFTIEPSTAAAICAHASRLSGISRERIGEELRRMLTHPRPSARQRAVNLLEELNLDAPVLNEPHRAGPNPSSDALAVPAPFPAALAAWLVDRHNLYLPADRPPHVGQLVGHLRSALCLTNSERDALFDTLECVGEVLTGWRGRPPAAQKRWASRPGFTAALDILAPHHPEVVGHARRTLRDLCDDGVGLTPTPLVDGDDLIGLGFRPGPVFKALLDRLYDEQLEGRLKTRSEGLELARVWGV
ncbi:MAG TPA: hypothetical protein VFF65_04755, partial [Phycisphaerales bacterium]|nr:hypothetical protein [Phycisphaerales bacterium]